MKTATAALTSAIILFILAAPLTVQANACYYLELNVPAPYYINGISCTKGAMDVALPHQAIFIQQDGHGPSCQVSVLQTGVDGSHWYSIFLVHQNLCVLKAGNINVTHQSGRAPSYTSKEGSFRHSRRGTINVTGFTPSY